MRRTVRLTETYPHPIERVWAALTTREALSAWLMPTDFRPEVGHRFTFRTDPAPGFDGVVHGEVTELTPPQLLAMRWRGGVVDSEVRFRLTPVATGTRLDLEHSGFEGPRGVLLSFLFSGGWPRLLRRRLAAHLAGNEGPEHMPTRRQRVMARVAALLPKGARK